MDNQFIMGGKPKLVLKLANSVLTTSEYEYIEEADFFAAVDNKNTVITADMSRKYVNSLDYERVIIESAWYYIWTELKALSSKSNLNIFEVQRKDYLTNNLARLEDGVYVDDVGNTVYVDEGKYFPYLKKYRGISLANIAIPKLASETYPNFHQDNQVAFKYHKSNIIGFKTEDILSKCRAFLIDQARILREVARYEGFIYDNYRFSGDRIVQADISGILMQFQLNTIPNNYVYRWKITNGFYYDFHGFNGTLDFSQKLAQFISIAFAREEVIVRDIAVMTLEQLATYDISEQFKHVNAIQFEKTEPIAF